MSSLFLFIAGVLGAIGVAFGAFGAHGLRSRLSADRLQTFQTGVTYQVYHALALLGTSLVVLNWNHTFLPVLAGWLFLAGVILFSGSLYLLVFSNNRLWGAITPFGGVAFIAGWFCLALTAISIKL